ELLRLNSNHLIQTRQRQMPRTEKSQTKSTPHSTKSDAMVGKLFDNLDSEQLLTAEQLAERLNIAVKTVRKWRYEGVLPLDSMVKLRHQVRYRWVKVLGWLNAKGKQ
ncbi:MAG TPA: helix-turn-helix domain-containing protein, partial [Oligoflexus sp.]|uniref:helix-turn-helix domain-containing protein n=1 Tax=Oligoflexus sp. TaxID=1971216 RepID=UPI002D3CC572